MAHIEFTANGVLMVALGLLLAELELGPTALKLWFGALQVGTWTNGPSTRSFPHQTASIIPRSAGCFSFAA